MTLEWLEAIYHMSATKRALHSLLSKVAHYAEFDVDDVASSLWKGSLVLRNVRFRAETLKSTASLGLTGMLHTFR